MLCQDTCGLQCSGMHADKLFVIVYVVELSLHLALFQAFGILCHYQMVYAVLNVAVHE